MKSGSRKGQDEKRKPQEGQTKDKKKGSELSDEVLKKVAGGRTTGDEDDLSDLEVQRIRRR